MTMVISRKACDMSEVLEFCLKSVQPAYRCI